MSVSSGSFYEPQSLASAQLREQVLHALVRISLSECPVFWIAELIEVRDENRTHAVDGFILLGQNLQGLSHQAVRHVRLECFYDGVQSAIKITQTKVDIPSILLLEPTRESFSFHHDKRDDRCDLYLDAVVPATG